MAIGTHLDPVMCLEYDLALWMSKGSCLAFGLRCLSFAVIQSNVILPEMTEAVRLIYLGAKTAGQSVLVTSDCASECFGLHF